MIHLEDSNKLQIHNQSLSPPRVIKHNIQHPEMPGSYQDHNMNNFARFQNNSKLLNINAMHLDNMNDLDFENKNKALHSRNIRNFPNKAHFNQYNTHTNFNVPNQINIFEQQEKYRRTIDRRIKNKNSYNFEIDDFNSQNSRSN